MEKAIKIENGITIKLPKEMVAQLLTDRLGYNVYFKGCHTYIPENATRLLAEEKLKDLAFHFFKDAKKTIDYLIN